VTKRANRAAERDQSPDWSRFHPLTPWLNAWLVFVALAFAAVNGGREWLAHIGDLAALVGLTWILVGLAAVILVTVFWTWLWWRKAWFRLADGSLQLAKGLIFRQRRHMPLDRVQTVDTIRPLLARVFGLVKLKVESAGGADSAIELAYLKTADAVHWRRFILSRAADARQAHASNAGPAEARVDPTSRELVDAAAAPSPAPPKSAETLIGEFLGDDDSEAPELFAVPTGRLIGSIALSVGTWATVLVVVTSVVQAVVTGSAGIALGSLPVLLGFGLPLWTRFASGFGFNAKQTARGLTLSHGLTTRVSQTIPPGRILAVQLSQGPLWRRLGWWRVVMNVAGYGAESDKQTDPVLVPVAEEETVRRAVWAVAPGLAQPGVWESVTRAMTGQGPTPGFATAPKRSRLLDPLGWRRNGFALTDEALVLRAGALLRRVVLVPHARIQSVEVRQGPLERRLGLAGVAFRSAPGPIDPLIAHLDAGDAVALARGESVRVLAAMQLTLDRSRGC
jgi:putative membrane protein